MAAFGPSTNQKNDQGALAEIPRWVFDAMKTNQGQAAAAFLKANGYTDQYVAQLQQVVQQGFGSPEQIRALGEAAMPGLQATVGGMDANVQKQIDNYGALPPAQGAVNDINAIQQTKDSQIGQNYQDVQGAIDQGFGSQRGRTSDVAGAIGADTAGTFGKLATNSDTAYGDAAAKTGAGFGAVKDSAAQQFGKIGQNSDATYGGVADRINQGRDFALGTTARAFAPAMAATLRRIRASGIDPNSPEAASLLQRVDTARGHAFDDSLQSTNAQLNANAVAHGQNQQGLDLSKLSNAQGLDLSKLSNDQMLALQNAANKQGLSLQDYMARTNLATQTRDIQNGLDAGNMTANVNNANAAFKQGQDAYTQQQQNVVNNRGLLINDQQNQNNLLDKQNNQSLIDQNMQNQQFGVGMNLQGANNQRVDQANQGVGQAGQQQFTVAQGQGQLANANAGTAGQGFGQSYAIEAPSSSWGTKALVGAGTAALGAFVPGFGGTNPFGKKPTSGGGMPTYAGGGYASDGTAWGGG